MAVERSIKRVPNLEHRNLNIDWNGLRLFILVGQNGRLRSASREAGLSINTVDDVWNNWSTAWVSPSVA